MNRETLQDGQHRPDPDERELLEKTIEVDALATAVAAARAKLMAWVLPILLALRAGKKLKLSEQRKAERLAKRYGLTVFGLTEQVRAAQESELQPMVERWVARDAERHLRTPKL